MGRVLLASLLAAAVCACSPANVGGPSDAGGSPKDGGGHADSGSAADTGAPRDSGSPTDAGSDSSAAKSCADYANARCSRLDTCSHTWILARYGDVATCVSRFAAFCSAAVTAPSAGATGGTYEACAQQIPQWSCQDILYGKNAPAPCMTVPGSVASGGTCAFATQCQSAFCAIVPGAACGQCAPLPSPGAPCAQLSTCGDLLTCSNANVCNPYAEAAGACSPSIPCDRGLSCVGDAGTGGPTNTGTCQVQANTPGANCTSNNAGCDIWSGLACNTNSQTCQPVVLGQNGDQCGFVNLQNTGCFDGLCVGIVGSMPGTCRQYGAIGAPCDLSVGPPCFLPARCIVDSDGGTAGTCQIPSAAQCP